MRKTGGTAFTPKLFSILKNGYGLSDFRSDALAGLTVAIVALPLAMALGIASGASPDKGLITAVVAGFLISLLGGSRVQVGGPTGAFVVVVFNVIAQHGYDGLIIATLLAGIILTIAGYARLGQVIKFIPHPVVTGFTAGIAVIIVSSQVKDFLGLRLEEVPADFIPKWAAYFKAFDTVNIATFLIGLGSLAGIIALRRIAPKAPGYLIAIAIASVAVALFHIPADTIGSRFPAIPSGLPMPAVPELSYEKFQEVLPSAFIIAFLAGIEALLSAVVADGMTGFKHRSNQELVGQGVANIASALFGGLPATGAIARTATNIKAGGKTPVAGIFHAVFLLLFIFFATDLMKFVPMAALAAILFMVAWGMSEAERFIHIFRMSTSDRVVLLLTFFLTVLVDLTVAIGVGVTLASLLFMARMSTAVEISTGISAEANESFKRNGEDDYQRAGLPPGVEAFRIAGPLFFGVAGELLETLKRMGQMPKVLIVRMQLVPFLDVTGASALESLVKQCRTSGTEVIFSAVQKQPAEILSKIHLGPEEILVRYAHDYMEAIAMANGMVNRN
ncbi:MAG: sodium-independent anion transporter [Alphaproteobacteria bacterium CG_4_9_14_3_um_filter_47_13]|nr:MAG: sodium-independent anion transporter [Alphaproteobacteria bacterium CG_4_9_14_3_um_filter_47_13]